jgi:hypothetical protein
MPTDVDTLVLCFPLIEQPQLNGQCAPRTDHYLVWLHYAHRNPSGVVQDTVYLALNYDIPIPPKVYRNVFITQHHEPEFGDI